MIIVDERAHVNYFILLAPSTLHAATASTHKCHFDAFITPSLLASFMTIAMTLPQADAEMIYSLQAFPSHRGTPPAIRAQSSLLSIHTIKFTTFDVEECRQCAMKRQLRHATGHLPLPHCRKRPVNAFPISFPGSIFARNIYC